MARTPADIRALTDDELDRTMDECQREALNLRLQQQTGQIENTARIRVVRREFARMKTEQMARAKQTQPQQAD
ncbi:MAG: 50S ribosomal protein L29 [Woeseiaceae bacterium]|nr:50S ribosomal protein L29 [Woeseiaceae bacterium]